MKKIVLLITIILLVPIFVNAKTKSLNLKEALEEEQIKLSDAFNTYKETDDQAIIYLFRGNGCGYCKAFLTFLNSILDDYGKYFKVISYEVWYDEDNATLMNTVAKYLEEPAGGVPYIVIGDKVFAGYAESYNNNIKEAIKNLYDTNKEKRYDVLKEIEYAKTKTEKEQKEKEEQNNKKIDTFSANIDKQDSKIKTNTILLIVFIALSVLNFVMIIVILIVFSIKISKLKKEKNA